VVLQKHDEEFSSVPALVPRNILLKLRFQASSRTKLTVSGLDMTDATTCLSVLEAQLDGCAVENQSPGCVLQLNFEVTLFWREHL